MDRVIRCAVQGTVPSDFHCPMAPVHTSLVHSYAADNSDCGGHRAEPEPRSQRHMTSATGARSVAPLCLPAGCQQLETAA